MYITAKYNNVLSLLKKTLTELIRQIRTHIITENL